MGIKMGLAAVVLLAVSWAPAQEPPCLSVYTPDFQEKAGIDPQEWSRVCASGADPKGYFLQRLKETKKAKARTLLGSVLAKPAEELTAQESKALLELDPDAVPPELRGAYNAHRDVAMGIKAGIRKPRTDPMAEDAHVYTPMGVQALRLAGWEELEPKECVWLRKMTRCTFEQLEEDFLFKVLFKKPDKTPYCFVHKKDPLNFYVSAYRQGIRTQAAVNATLEGSKTFGARGGGLRCR